MPSASPLILLPPRHTARTPIDSSSTASTHKSSDDSFSEKLHHARKTSVTAKPAAEPPKPKAAAVTAKASPVKTASAKTVSSADPEEQSAAEDSAAKNPVVDHPVDTDETQTSEAAEQGAEATHSAEAAHSLPGEPKTKTTKLAKDGKAAAAKAKSVSPIQVSPVNTGHKPVEDAVSKSDEDADTSDTTGDVETVKAAADSLADPAAQPGALFGTGKVVDAKPSGDGDGTDDADDASTAAAAEVAANSVASASAGSVSAAADSVVKSTPASDGTSAIDALSGLGSSPAAKAATTGTKSAAAASPQARFVEDNQPKIVSSIKGQLLPHGGTMQLRLDPPELGPLQVTVHMRDGVMTASFETSSDSATKALSHSLGQLKTGLEAAGMTVEKLHVEQTPGKDASSDSEGESRQPPQEQQQQAQQDQQRREMVQKMWRRLAGGDPLDLVA